mmetsp:Transcript_56732/g.105030  ORF Transcript_56732/g.105030 Transcript_56732/m.105030 type:complete len:256 (-) Transcript_56732:64-831(-)
MAGISSGDPELDFLLAEDDEDGELQMAVALSMSSPLPPARFMDDPKEVERAISQSLESAAVEEKQRTLQKRKEDPELLEAALRASLIDLGPKGVSQAAKIMDTGDDSLGHAKVLKRTGTHRGAGAPFQRPIDPTLAPTPSSSSSPSGGASSTKPAESNALTSPSGGRAVAAAAASVVGKSNTRAGSKSSPLLQMQHAHAASSHAAPQEASRPGSRAGSKSMTRSQLQEAGRTLTTTTNSRMQEHGAGKGRKSLQS